MPHTKILACDPSMTSTGWMLLTLDTETAFSNENPPSPSWITKKDTTGNHLYHHFKKVDGGTFKSDPEKPFTQRIVYQTNQILQLVEQFQPSVFCLESQLEKGENKNPYGVALLHTLIYPFYPGQPELLKLRNWIPYYIIMLRPERLQSVAHHERSTTGRTVVERYKLLTNDKVRVSQHESDAFFIGVYAGRFWATCLHQHWPREILTKNEKYAFLESNHNLLSQEGNQWWRKDPDVSQQRDPNSEKGT